MSLTVRKILELPSLRGATVVAGENALERTVSSVSVLEYSTPNEKQHRLFEAINFEGNELVITAFTSICQDSKAQMEVIHRLAEAGEVGILLYYVGTFVPFIHDDVISTADSLNFALIEMPHSLSLRYSDAISEISEAILKEESTDSNFVAEILEDISLLSPELRSVSTVLRMLRDRLRASLILSDMSGNVINISTFPHGRENELKDCIESDAPNPAWYVYRTYIQGKDTKTFRLTIIRENGSALLNHQIAMTVETLHLFLVIWSPNHGQAVISELVRAILQDESLKMRRLAALFGIDVKSLDTMFVIRSSKDIKFLLDIIRKKLSSYIDRPIVDFYEDNVVLFLASSIGDDILESISNLLAEENLIMARAYNLKNTSEVRKAFLEIQPSLDSASKVYRKKVLNLSDIQLVNYFLALTSKGELEIETVLAPVKVIEENEDADVLLQTLETYILDADSSTLRTSRMLNVHNNTIKYRIKRISAILHADITKAPQSITLYRAMMMRRILYIQSG